MITWLWILGVFYIATLALLSYVAWRRTKSADEYVMAGSNVGMIVGLLTYSATLFSTFTLMGMPDFFRVHGVGAWIFLAVSDGAQVCLIVWFGLHLRRRARERGFRGTAGLLASLYESRMAGYVYFAGVFLFLTPYVAIQIRGLAIFLEAIFPDALPAWVWSAGIIVIMLVYSEIGGLRAIMYSDVLQGLMLLTIVWIVAVVCVGKIGGFEALFESARTVDERLLSVPGPRGLFTVQFLVASFFAVLLLPVSQPQLTTRLMIIRDQRKMNRMAVAIGCFVIVILFPVALIGMYGASQYPGADTRTFLSGVLLNEQTGFVGAAVVVGLLAAAMSTADSQIFALGTELRSLLSGDEKVVLRRTKWAVIAFGAAAMVFSVLTTDQLVLLARVSFSGTALLAPMILAGVLSSRPPGGAVVAVSGVALVIFLMSLAGIVPEMIGPARLDLLLLGIVAAITAISLLTRRRKSLAA